MRVAGIVLTILLILRDPAATTEAARQACRIWAAAVLPALFPFMTLSLLLVAGRSARGPGRFETAPLLILGLAGGSPAGAKLLAAQAAQGRLSPRQAQRLAAACTTCSPMFVLGTLTAFLDAPPLGLPMLAAHWLGAWLAGLCCVAWTRGWKGKAGKASGAQAAAPLTLAEAIGQAASAMLLVCGCMILFNVLLEAVSSVRPLTPAGAAGLGSLLEMAGGCARIAGLGLPKDRAAALLCAAVSFGGLSIWTQNAAFLRNAGVRLPVQLAARVLHAVLSYMICRALLAPVWQVAALWLTPCALAALAACLWQPREGAAKAPPKAAAGPALTGFR